VIEPRDSFTIRALGADVRWTVPLSVMSWLRDDVFRGLVVAEAEAEPGAEITWTHDDSGWRAAALGDHMAGPGPEDLLPDCFIALNRAAAESMADDHLVLHAGAFSVSIDGLTDRAVALCGTSGAGKSTATAAATMRGHGYLADEVCALRPDGWTVRRYHRPVGLRPGGAAAIGASAEPAHEAGEGPPSRIWHSPTRAERDTTLGSVALVERRPGAVNIERLAPATALELLVQHTLGSEGRERVMFRRSEQLVRALPVVRLQYEDVFEAIDAVAEFVRSEYR
jgi:hypothetical protein